MNKRVVIAMTTIVINRINCNAVLPMDLITKFLSVEKMRLFHIKVNKNDAKVNSNGTSKESKTA